MPGPQQERSIAPWYRQGDLGALRRRMADVFERMWDGDAFGAGIHAPSMDVREKESSIQIQMDLPGLKPEEIDIQVSGNQITVSGNRKEEREEKGELFHCLERQVGHFSRSVALPCPVEPSKVDANYQNGVLTVTIPKSDEAKTKRISVKPS